LPFFPAKDLAVVGLLFRRDILPLDLSLVEMAVGFLGSTVEDTSTL